MKENFEKKSGKEVDEETLRHKIHVLLKSDIKSLEDEEFKKFLSRHFFTEGDVKKAINEEKEKLVLEEENKDKERKYYKAHEKR